jgi:hypothetical protein
MIKISPKIAEKSRILSMIRVLLFLSFLGNFVLSSSAQSRTPKKRDISPKKEIQYADINYKDAIRMVQLFAKGNEFITPAIGLESSDKITLKFDDLTGGFTTYSYTFIHCNAKWEPSNIFESQYMEGFFQNEIRDYKFGVNTKQTYTSYTVDFPNQYVKFLASGNYILFVYENGNKNKPILTRRFFVFEQNAGISSEIRRSFSAGSIQTNQCLDIKVNPSSALKVFSPLTEFMLAVQQNKRWDNASADITPNLLEDKTLVYTFNDRLNFPANNEFRQFDTRSLGINSLNVRKFYSDSVNHILLYDDQYRYDKPYNNYFDINGSFATVQRDGLITSRDPDYTFVQFQLNSNGPITEGNVYLMGGLTNWQTDSSSLMNYHEGCACYQKTLYLKQGYYNYMYGVKKDDQKTVDFNLIEGSFQGTDNEYNILVYFRSQIGLYDRLVAFQTIYSNGNK